MKAEYISTFIHFLEGVVYVVCVWPHSQASAQILSHSCGEKSNLGGGLGIHVVPSFVCRL